LDHIRQELPLTVGAATLGTAWFNVHGPDEEPTWYLTVSTSLWRLTQHGETVLSVDDEGDEDDEQAVAFLVGTKVTGVDGDHPEHHGKIAFVFDDTYRLEITPDDYEYESWVFKAPGWFFAC
jgi:hypothetical protein